jgi:hypothetical protein
LQSGVVSLARGPSISAGDVPGSVENWKAALLALSR